MIQSIESFINYFESIRRRTLNYIHVIPPDRLEWSPKPEEFTCGDILRHLIAAENMFVRVAVEGYWKYEGHAAVEKSGLDEVIAMLETSHAQAMTRLKQLPDEILYESRPALKGPPVKVWRWLMAMVEHEIHHRSQLAVYLSLMGLKPPQIYGLGVEDIVALTTE